MSKLDIMSDKFQSEIEQLDKDLKELREKNESMKQDIDKLWQEYIRLTKDDMK